jgi:hypothetical protein
MKRTSTFAKCGGKARDKYCAEVRKVRIEGVWQNTTPLEQRLELTEQQTRIPTWTTTGGEVNLTCRKHHPSCPFVLHATARHYRWYGS